ncbi:MAG: choloylglycine hydrolase [Roseburia sp.]|nr:choloylglycine hydrolase [Roseburia sp.]
MCTAVSFLTKDHYFGRNLDLEYSYEESIVITPRNFSLPFRKKLPLETHYSMIGIAYVCDNYPLYYDATNEAGLSMAGLNFPEYADYKPAAIKKDNIAPFEFIPWILGQCATIAEAKELLSKVNLLEEPFHNDLPLTPLHWMIADRNSSIVIESVKDNLHIYNNPVGVLTNSPSFDMQLFHLNNYLHLTRYVPQNLFASGLDLKKYSNGMGAIGMPGDWSSQSRFVKASFVKMNSVCGTSEVESVSQFFHILSSVEHPRGCVVMNENHYEITLYSSCCNTDKGIYYYKTYDNNQISAVDMHKTNLGDTQLIVYPLNTTPQVFLQN